LQANQRAARDLLISNQVSKGFEQLASKEIVMRLGPFALERSLPHGHIAAVLGVARKLGLDRLLPQRPSRPSPLRRR